VGATIATFHDVLAVLGIFYLMGREINLILVTALLTIAGYSLTDTVVVFDRIRENMKVRHKEPLESIMNASINEVLSRTIITSVTVLLTSGALFFFGGEVIHDFALAMIMGVVIGTYSSIFIASPTVLLWGRKKRL
jgi:preprotein translocase subunit SecF